jgi:hypothetical protein
VSSAQWSRGWRRKLDATINCTTEVNAARAGQSGSIATRTKADEPLPSGIRVLSRAEVMATSRRRGKDKSPPEVNLSLFVQISQDLSPEARRAVRKKIGELACARAGSWTPRWSR